MLLVANLDTTKLLKKPKICYPMNTNMTGFRWLSKNLCDLVLGTKETSALEGLLIYIPKLLLLVGYHQNSQASLAGIG